VGILFARAFTEQALLDAWDTVRAAALADGQPDAEVARFEDGAARRIAELAAELAAGEWEPQPVRRVEIPKPGGGVRRLGVPPLADRVVERALLTVLDPEIDPRLLPWSFAYRRGLGARDAVAALEDARDTGLGWVARADVKDFFERVPQWEVLRRLREAVDDERVVHLVGMLLDRTVAGGRAAPLDRGRGLHQGSVVSPLLSNLYLDVLELNSGKSHVASFDGGVRFLGETVTASTLNAAEAVSHPLETSVYVDRQGSLIRVRGENLVVVDGEEALLRLNLRRVRQVTCYGRVGLTTAFLHRALERGIEVVLLDRGGSLGGRLTAPCASDPTVRRAQYRAADDPDTCRTIAAALIAGKIGNMRVTLLRAARRQDDLDAAIGAERLAALEAQLPDAASLDVLLGLEGAASREYFQAAQRMVDPMFGFTARQRRPPPDPINAMLSYGYTLLCHEVIAALEGAGLDPLVGVLHQHRWGRPALALDLMEEFRPMTVDVAVWRLTGSRTVRAEQFTVEPDLGCRMGDDARAAFLAAYERRMLTLTTHPAAGRRVSFRVAIGVQAKALAAALLDPGRPYRALRWK